jgi:SAM-dependent methyltransferase
VEQRVSVDDSVLSMDYPECLQEDFPRVLPVARAAVDRVLATLQGRVLDGLARHSPGLKHFDWPNYLRCSIARMAHAAHAAERSGVSGGLVLDCGSYFGNFSLMFRRLGFAVHALDGYRDYGDAFTPMVDLLRGEGAEIRDFADVGEDLARLPGATYDLVWCGGVIEHIPHTPRLLLAAFDRVLKPGGLLIMDTPNLVHIYNRQKFSRGESVMPEIQAQFHTDIPFQGHHREYTVAEMVWMLQEIGHTELTVELFNYSLYGNRELVGRDIDNHWAMVADPTLRELIMTTSRKPAVAGPIPAPAPDWRSLFQDPERVWQRRLLESGRSMDAASNAELILVRLQEEVQIRDRLLADLDARMQAEIQVRDDRLFKLDRELEERRLPISGVFNRLRRLLSRRSSN